MIIQDYAFREERLDEEHSIFIGSLPAELYLSDSEFETLWNLHPPERPSILIHGREVQVPRWQKAYDFDYKFSGVTSKADPMPELVLRYRDWCQQTIDHRLNGALVNFYSGAMKHRIGAHRDKTVGIVPETEIVTISFGEERVFRMRPYKGKGFTDFIASPNSVIVIPLSTNECWKHEVPHSAKYAGRRISITFRAFIE